VGFTRSRNHDRRPALPETVFADNDEAHAKLLFGVENDAINGVRNALEATRKPKELSFSWCSSISLWVSVSMGIR
jgi:hypothetical protein